MAEWAFYVSRGKGFGFVKFSETYSIMKSTENRLQLTQLVVFSFAACFYLFPHAYTLGLTFVL